MPGSQTIKGFQAKSEHMLLQNCGNDSFTFFHQLRLPKAIIIANKHYTTIFW